MERWGSGVKATPSLASKFNNRGVVEFIPETFEIFFRIGEEAGQFFRGGFGNSSASLFLPDT